MKIWYSILKSLITSACLISIGGQSLVSHAMDYNKFYIDAKDDLLLDVNKVCTREDFNRMENKGYKIKKLIGSGHSGFVFLATDPNGRECVIKFTTNSNGNNDINLYLYNVFELDELPKKYRNFFKYISSRFGDDDFRYISSVGDKLLYDKLGKTGIVDLGENACKILGIEEIKGTDKICVILEYIKGTPLCEYEDTYDTQCVKNWLKGICKSLNIMYKNDFLHKSIGQGNILIRDDDKSAVLIDYERVISKGLFEKLLEIRKCKFENRSKYFNEDGSKMKLNSPNAKLDCYDLDQLTALIYDITSKSNYQMSHQTLHENILNLENANNLEEFLKKVDEL